MCSISGIFLERKLDAKILLKMNEIQRHRGPDDEGYFFENEEIYVMGGKDTLPNIYKRDFPYSPIEDINSKNIKFFIGLASRRLNILDLSERGHQPMCNENKNIWVVHNGAIYNFKELREILVKKGYKFFSKTDTEVIIHGYQEWRENLFEKLNGMWAFAIYDRRRKKLILSRDRYGIKPLYYYFNGKMLIFSSEIKGIFASKLITPEVDNETLEICLKTGYINFNNKSFFKYIKELSPASYIEFDTREFRITERKYYTLPLKQKKYNDGEAIEKFKELFFDSVKKRLISDVPIGTCLSGGLDSSSIVCVINKILKENGNSNFPIYDIQKTFSARYLNFIFDEGQYIKEVANFCKIKSYFTFPSPDGLKKEIQSLIWHQEEPFANTSIYAQWCVFKLASETDVKVILDGQGSDEILAGYPGYKYPYLSELIRNFKFSTYIKEILSFKSKEETIERLIRKSLRDLLPPLLFQKWIHIFKPDKVFVNPDRKIKNVFQRTLYRDFTSTFPVLLKYEDRNSMAHSIEARVPFLDYRLVEFVFSLPDNFKIRDGISKWILRESMKNILPEKIRTRKDKIGYFTPEFNWFRNDLKEFIYGIFNSKKFKERGIFDINKLNQDINLHMKGIKNKSDVIWRHLNIELWFQNFIDRIY